ncbi:hypothetical protein F2Q69_00023646 [Brassica cretica]|uniref:PUM-HD domain-containing protein n=1 Tax=Brassica cretica TaxID=69181 RepID=A0A8S9QFD0_BRACR|nr:hypothetical protein F2Q69_00023646 [Brassica cretica]
MAIGPRTSHARSLRSDRAQTKLGCYVATELAPLIFLRCFVNVFSLQDSSRYVATELSPKLGRYIATELSPKLGRYIATELSPKLGRYIATELSPKLGRYVATKLSPKLVAT